MNYIFDNEKPIYIQLVEMIRIDIVSDKFKKGIYQKKKLIIILIV